MHSVSAADGKVPVSASAAAPAATAATSSDQQQPKKQRGTGKQKGQQTRAQKRKAKAQSTDTPDSQETRPTGGGGLVCGGCFQASQDPFRDDSWVVCCVCGTPYHEVCVDACGRVMADTFYCNGCIPEGTESARQMRATERSERAKKRKK